MIVRILTEGQYSLPSAQLDQINEIDNKLVDAVASGDRKEYHQLFAKMIETVREKGKPLGPEALTESQIILPAPDTTLDEAKSLFTGDGLIPG